MLILKHNSTLKVKSALYYKKLEMHKVVFGLCTAIIMATVSFWAVLNLYYSWGFWDKRGEVTSCLVQPLYICTYNSILIFCSVSYALWLLYKNIVENPALVHKIILLICVLSYLTITFMSLMILNSSRCMTEVKDVYAIVTVYIWGHFITSFTAFLIFGGLLKENFPFFSNYLTIMGFLLNTYNMRSTITSGTPQTELIEVITQIQASSQQPESHQPESNQPESNHQPELPQPSQQELSHHPEEKTEEKTMGPLPVLSASLADPNDSGLQLSIIPTPPNCPPPPHVVEGIRRCQEKIKQLKLQNPNSNYQIMPTPDGMRIVEIEVTYLRPNIETEPIAGLRRRGSGEV